jgi:hypothetical protein
VPDYINCKNGDKAMLGDLAGNLPKLGVIVEGAGKGTRKINFRPGVADRSGALRRST